MSLESLKSSKPDFEEIKIYSYFQFLPDLVIFKVLKMLSSDSLLSMSQTCSRFHFMAQQNYLLDLTLPLENGTNIEKIKRKKVLRMKLNIIGSMMSYNDNWESEYIDVLKVNSVVEQLKHFDIENTSEICININFKTEVILPYQPREDYSYLMEITKKMPKLKKEKICICSNGIISNLDFVYYMHVRDLLLHSTAKQVIIKLPSIISMDNLTTPLIVSKKAEKLTIIGPCEGLVGSKTRLWCENLSEIVIKSSNQHCTLKTKDDSMFHRNGICVMHAETVLMTNGKVQYYNNIFVGDIKTMQKSCGNDTIIERFFEDYKTCGGKEKKVDWLKSWNNMYSFL